VEKSFSLFRKVEKGAFLFWEGGAMCIPFWKVEKCVSLVRKGENYPLLSEGEKRASLYREVGNVPPFQKAERLFLSF